LERLNEVDLSAGNNRYKVCGISFRDKVQQLRIGEFPLDIEADPPLKSGVQDIVELEVILEYLVRYFGDVGFIELKDNPAPLLVGWNRSLDVPFIGRDVYYA
jgi:hypothetical protein